MKKELEKLKNNFFIPFCFVLFLWLIKAVEVFLETSFSSFGVYPRQLSGLKGIVFYPLIHGDLLHLFNNSMPLLALGFMLFNSYRKVSWKVVFYIYIISGMGVWLIARPSHHIGASGIVYGLAFFLFCSGVFRKDIRSMALAMIVTFAYGGIIWGLLPIKAGVSWEGHLSGALVGVYLAWYYRKVDLPKLPEWMKEDGNENKPNIEDPFWIAKELPEILDQIPLENPPQSNVRYIYKKSQDDPNRA